MTTVTKLDGAPGVGKTTALFETVEDLAKDGYALDDILYLTFTRASRGEAREELGDVFTGAERRDVKKRALTVHGAALVACLVDGPIENPGVQVITRDDDPDVYATFCRRNGLEFAPDESDPFRDGAAETEPDASGNQLLAIAEFLALSRRPHKDFHRAPVSSPFSPSMTVELLEAWDAFKQAGTTFPNDDGDEITGSFYEHHDYVEEAIEWSLVYPGRALFIDEFQDLSPLEYSLYKKWRESGQFDRIYIAGDPNQSIYGFREANPYYFENTPVDDVMWRKESYRVREAPAAVARGVLDAHPATDPSGFHSASGDGGSARAASAASDAALAELVRRNRATHDGELADVFVLARTNRHVRAIGSTLRREGVPYTTLGVASDLWTGGLAGLYRALVRLRDGEPVPALGVKALLDALPESAREGREEALGGPLMWTEFDEDDHFIHEDARSAFPEPPAQLAKQLPALAPYRREAIVNALTAGESAPPHTVAIGTIHGSKGLEAPCVLLSDASSSAVEDAYYADKEAAAEEHRLYYVGATRCSETLVIVRDLFDGPVFPGFAGDIPTSPASDDDDDGNEVDA